MMGVYGIVIGDNEWYIGSSVDVEKRKNNHLVSLRNNNHPNADMQSVYDNTSNAIALTLVETECKTKLESLENYYMGIYDSIEKGFNKTVAIRSKNIEIKPLIKIIEKTVDHFLKIDEIAVKLLIEEKEVELLIKLGMPFIRLPHKKMKGEYRFMYSTVIKWLEDNSGIFTSEVDRLMNKKKDVEK